MAARIFKRLTLGCGAVCVIGGVAVVVDVKSRITSDTHTFTSALRQYALVSVLRAMGKRVWKQIEKDTENIRQAQETTLLEQLKENANTAYGLDHKFDKIQSAEEFLALHPLTRYDYYRPYINRIIAGEEKILTCDIPKILALTSGTSGEASMIPMISKHRNIFFKYGITTCYYFMTESFPGTYNLQKSLKIFFTPKQRPLVAGIPQGPNSANPQDSKSVWLMYTSPPPAYDIKTEPEATYVYLLFALKDTKVGLLESNFVSMIYTALQSLEKNWPNLVDDIEKGRVSPDLNIVDSVRAELDALLKPDPIRAQQLKEEFALGFQGIVRRIWPQCHLVLSVDSGVFELYGKLMREGYCEGIPHYSPLYGATEGLVGLNVDPKAEKREYLLLPRAMFYEFIPIENSNQSQPQTLLMDQVEKDKVYELVVTNMSCMYRYRFGDVVKISSFLNQCPKVEFLYRQGQFLNLRGEKISERLFYEAVETAATSWKNKKIVDYCCMPSAHLKEKNGGVPHYVMFVELHGHSYLTQDEKKKMDTSLCEKSFVYESFRQKESISPIEVYVVRSGTFQDLKAFMVKKGKASLNQFKVPRVLHKPEAIQFMLSRVVE